MDTALPAPIPARTLYQPWQRVAFLVLGGWITLIGVLTWPNREGMDRVLYTFAALYGLWWMIRGAMLGVRIDTRGIAHRSLGLTRRVDWCSVQAIGPSEQGAGPARSMLPEITTNSGTQLPLQAIATRSVTDAQAHLDALTAAHATHRAACQTCAA
ncbi:hypothetical protein ACFW6S_31655 [Streptomyces sp. NPDC058740]|uniref:hypothetical protein n=1 Tax=Streptomyces sp. NPDC058740 TaxID=3346619 RepID=UPI003699DCAB